MLSKDFQYKIAFGVFQTFKQNKLTNGDFAKGSEKYSMYLSNKFETFSSQKFKIACLYIQFKKNSSSLISLLKEVNNITEEEIRAFIIELKTCNSIMLNDIQKINTNSYLKNDIYKSFKNKDIHWSTFYFWKKDEELTRLERVQVDRISPIFQYIKIKGDIYSEILNLKGISDENEELIN